MTITAGCRRILLVVVILLVTGTEGLAYAEGAADPAAQVPVLHLSLREAIEAAVDNSPTVRLFRERIRQAKGQEDLQRGALLPNLSGGVSQRYFTFNLAAFGIPATGIPGGPVVGPVHPFDARGFLTQNLFSLSLIERWRAARTGVEVAELDAETTKRDTMATVALLYLEAIRAEAAVRAREANLELNRQLLKLAQDRKEAGLATGLDVTRAQFQVEAERQRLLSAENDEQRAKLNLIRAIGIDFNVALELSDPLALVEVPALSPAEALSVAQANRVELKLQERRERQASLALRSVTSERLPSLAGTADYGSIGLDVSDTTPTYTLGVTLSVPIWDGGQREARVAERRSLLRQEKIKSRDVQDQVTLEVRDALLTLRTAKQQVLVAEEGQRLARREVELSRERFAVGVANNVEVTNAQTSLALATDSLIDSLFRYNASRVHLARAQGRLDALY